MGVIRKKALLGCSFLLYYILSYTTIIEDDENFLTQIHMFYQNEFCVLKNVVNNKISPQVYWNNSILNALTALLLRKSSKFSFDFVVEL